GYLTASKTPNQAVEVLVAKAKDSGTGARAVADKLLAEKVIDKPEALPQGIDRLLKDHKAVLALIRARVADKADDLARSVEALMASKRTCDMIAEKLVKEKVG